MEFYRYEIDVYDEIGNSRVILQTFHLFKETPAGYWIKYKHSNQKFKWIPKVSKKRYAYPNLSDARINFVKRTTMRLRILRYQMEKCEKALEEIKHHH